MKPLELGMLLRYIKSVFVGILLVFPYLNVNAQQMETVDYTGAITKFDTQFDGIGPRVYLLPHPPSQHDLIDSAFLRKEAIGLDPHSALVKMFFLTNLKATTQVLGPWSALPKHTGPKQSAEGWLIQEMDRVKPLQNTNYLADLQNLLACEYARIGLTELAIPLFEAAINTKSELKLHTQVADVRFNMASMFAFQQNWPQAESLFAENYKVYRQHGNVQEQNYARMHLAYARAAIGQYKEAEKTLIEEVLPTFKRHDHATGRVQGFITLAAVYRLQKRYPEVQWFLLQAKEIAEQQKWQEQLADIIFHLAEAKNLSGNKQVAIHEYLMAQELAEKNQWLPMQLAIQDALGSIYHGSGNYEEAARALYRYDALLDQILAEDYLITP